MTTTITSFDKFSGAENHGWQPITPAPLRKKEPARMDKNTINELIILVTVLVLSDFLMLFYRW